MTNLAQPLVEQHARRHQAKRAQAGSTDCGDGQSSFAASGGESDDAALVGEFPSCQSGLLVRAELDCRPGGLCRPWGLLGVLECDADLVQPASERG
jgi:hypothetical protein